MLIDGEKWACEACVRGHRVSNCQHHDRPLQHINKKGRPVSQCPHCRSLRKSRASHVKCDCHEKGHSKAECPHLEGTEKKVMCCCSHGGKCSCALKKEHSLKTVPEMDLVDDSGVKPKLPMALSENTPSVASNGHRKAAVKHNQSAHKCGAPYKLPRSNTISHSSPSHRARERPRSTTISDTAQSSLNTKNSMQPSRRHVRLVKSEHGSPPSSAISKMEQLNSQLPPLDLSYSNMTFSQTMSGTAASATSIDAFDNNYFPSPDADQSMFSAGLPPFDWTGFDFDLNNPMTSSAFPQPPSYESFDYTDLSQPPLTNTSSGEISEADELFTASDPSPNPPPSLVGNGFASEPSEFGESDNYRLSAASSYGGLPQASLLASNNLDTINLDDYMNLKGSPLNGLETPSDPSASLRSSPGFPPYDVLPKAGHASRQVTSQPSEEVAFSYPASSEGSQIWMPQPTSNAGMFFGTEMDETSANGWPR